MILSQRILLIGLIILAAVSAPASWMGETWLWVRVDKVYKHTSGSQERKVRFTVLQWGWGAGHGDSYGKKFPGRTFTKTWRFPSSFAAARLSVGDTAWIKHHASTSMGYNRETKKRIYYSSDNWRYLGDTFGNPLRVTRTPSDHPYKSSPPIQTIYKIYKNGYLTLKVKYKTQGHYNAQFKLYLNKNHSANTVPLHLAYTTSNPKHIHSQNRRKYDQKILQFDLREFSGKTVIIYGAGKKIAQFP